VDVDLDVNVNMNATVALDVDVDGTWTWTWTWTWTRSDGRRAVQDNVQGGVQVQVHVHVNVNVCRSRITRVKCPEMGRTPCCTPEPPNHDHFVRIGAGRVRYERPARTKKTS
jgi:hypothetical protein